MRNKPSQLTLILTPPHYTCRNLRRKLLYRQVVELQKKDNTKKHLKHKVHDKSLRNMKSKGNHAQSL